VNCNLSAFVCLQYGSCESPAGVASVEALQSYLLDTARALRRRNTTAADVLQQLAANIAQSAPQTAALQQELNETRVFLHGSKDKIIEHMVEITSLKKKTGSQEHEIQQKQREVEQAQHAVKAAQQEIQQLQQQVKEKEEQLKKQPSQQQEVEQAQNAANSAKQEVEKLQQQLKEKEEQLKKQVSQPAQQQQQQQQQQVATAPLDEDVVFGRMSIMELAGLQCNPVKDQEVWGCRILGVGGTAVVQG
jgi:chromosome segregation ATPase